MRDIIAKFVTVLQGVYIILKLEIQCVSQVLRIALPLYREGKLKGRYLDMIVQSIKELEDNVAHCDLEIQDDITHEQKTQLMSPERPMVCNKCGQTLAEEMQFCIYCGNRIIEPRKGENRV